MSAQPVPPCPDCAGPWLNGWRWQHSATDCALRAAEDATQAADAQRLRELGRTYTRPITPAEARLWQAVTGVEPPRRSAATIHHGVIDQAWVRQINQHISAQTAA